MARTNQRRISDINDMFIYQSGKNYVYCGPFSKKGYIVTNDNARAYTLFASRYILAITVLLFLALTTKNVLLSIGAGILTFVFFEVLFRVKFLANLPVIDNFVKPQRASIVESMAESFSVPRIIALICFGVGLVVLVPINAKLQNYEGMLLYVNYAVAIGVGIYTLMGITALIKKLKNR